MPAACTDCRHKQEPAIALSAWQAYRLVFLADGFISGDVSAIVDVQTSVQSVQILNAWDTLLLSLNGTNAKEHAGTSLRSQIRERTRAIIPAHASLCVIVGWHLRRVRHPRWLCRLPAAQDLSKAAMDAISISVLDTNGGAAPGKAPKVVLVDESGEDASHFAEVLVDEQHAATFGLDPKTDSSGMATFPVSFTRVNTRNYVYGVTKLYLKVIVDGVESVQRMEVLISVLQASGAFALLGHECLNHALWTLAHTVQCGARAWLTWRCWC